MSLSLTDPMKKTLVGITVVGKDKEGIVASFTNFVFEKNGNLEKVNQINKIKLRIKNGIKEELIPLVRLRGIGRVRARRLYNAGLKNVLKLRAAKLDELSRILGKATAEKVKEQVSKKVIRES